MHRSIQRAYESSAPLNVRKVAEVRTQKHTWRNNDLNNLLLSNQNGGLCHGYCVDLKPHPKQLWSARSISKVLYAIQPNTA